MEGAVRTDEVLAFQPTAQQLRYTFGGALLRPRQVIDVYVSPRRDGRATRCFFTRALATTKLIPVEVTTNKPASTRMLLRPST